MVFKRRDKRSIGRQVWEAFFPKKGWRRAFEYIGHRVRRLPDTPHKISIGFACGVFVSFSPLFGFHFVYAALCALIVRGKKTLIRNSLTLDHAGADSPTSDKIECQVP